MAIQKLSAEETAALNTPPEPTPLEDTPADRTPNTEVEEQPEPQATEAKPKGSDKPDDKGKKGEPEKQRTVPHGAMEAERQRRKALEQELARERQAAAERNARLDERLAIINEALQPKSQPEQPPTPDQDIFGYAEHMAGRIAQLEKQVADATTTQQRRAAEAQRAAAITNAYRADAQRYAAEQPEFVPAYNFLLAQRQKQLTAAGYDPQTVATAVRNDEMAIVSYAMQRGTSPAETIYNMAVASGFAVKPADEPVSDVGNGAAQPQPNGADKITQLEKTREASISLSTAGGAPGGEKITLEAIDRMKPDEFKAFVARLNKNNPKGFDRMMEKLMLGG